MSFLGNVINGAFYTVAYGAALLAATRPGGVQVLRSLLQKPALVQTVGNDVFIYGGSRGGRVFLQGISQHEQDKKAVPPQANGSPAQAQLGQATGTEGAVPM